MQRFQLRQGKLRPDVDGKWVQYVDVADLLAACEALLEAGDEPAIGPALCEAYVEGIQELLPQLRTAIEKAKRTE